ncbi:MULTISPECIES: hypothetical protein [Moorena]|uniref:Uncharacterized protein n=2 Tax=Moorena producens TaxID=1155739 RepID=A0A1D9FXI0_MOOP1|nr:MULTISPECIES: hypothetical protein [Moorena]NEQ16021.1 hypothetical protein [Moorena sp. SIO3E2]AOY79984.1 hypothetical protein BJP36_08660 [Moorena producens JHB]EGJ35400.1 hypothetical protein LYNGBM3L_04680 [Moorena producens 3L]NEP68625.1 hypothetical protein [Moorena sp. SIO3A5]NEQ07978.1 hypothetical protein [Moorena sp. SIO4E2]
MTIKLQFKPEVEARIIAKAAAKGVSVQTYLESVIEDSLMNQEQTCFYETVTDKEWNSELMDLINSPAFTVAPPLADTAVVRESIYTREEEML